jgi:PAS domain S-box-containing protein
MPSRGERENEARLRAIVESAVDGIVTIDEQGTVAGFNPAAQRIFGYNPEEVVGRNVKMLMPPPYRDAHDGYLANYVTTGIPKIIGSGREVEGLRKDGTVFPLDLSVSEIKLGARRLFTGIVRDISERKRAEEERQKFVSLVENSSDAIAMASLTWEVFYINRAGQELIGLRPEDTPALEIRDLWHEATLPEVTRALPIQASGASFRFQGQLKHLRTGEPVDVDCNAFGILHPSSGETLAVAFSMRDIREQKRSEQALRDSEARMKAILGNAVDGILTIDERGTIEMVNPAAQGIFGYAAEELLGQNVRLLMPEPYRSEHDQYLRNYRHTGQRKIIGSGREVLGRRKNGEVFPIDLSVSEVQLGDRRLFTGLVRDIAERKQSEEHRNLLLAELSHRVKNTLASVLSIAMQTAKNNSSLEAFWDAFEGRLRALSLTHDLLAERGWVGAELASVLAYELRPFQAEDGSNTAVSGPAVVLNPKQTLALGMVFHELATNAAKYGAFSSAGGRVAVGWELRRDAAPNLSITWREEGGPPVETPRRYGFGRVLIERGVKFDLNGTADLEFAPTGLRCTISMPLAA